MAQRAPLHHGADTLTALASDPLLLGPICRLVGPAAAPAFAARLELLDPAGEAEHVVDVANALASLVPMLAKVNTQTQHRDPATLLGVFGGSTVGTLEGTGNREGRDDDLRGLVATSFIRAIPPVAALLAQGRSVGRLRAISALRRIASVCGHSLLKVMAAHDVIAATANELQATSPAAADVGIGRVDGLKSAIERKRAVTSSHGGDDVRDGGDAAAVAMPAARDDAVQLLAALVAAAGDDVSSAAAFPAALARAVAFAAVDSVDASTTAAALRILRSMTSGIRDANRRTVYEAGVVPALVLFLRPGEALASRNAAAATLRNLSIVDEITLNTSAHIDDKNRAAGGAADDSDVHAGGALFVLTRLQDAIAGIIAAHETSTDDNTAAAPQPWALNAMHPLLRRLLHEIHVKYRSGDDSGRGGGTHAETEPGILRLTRLLAKADGRSGFNNIIFGAAALSTASNPGARAIDVVDDGFDVIGAWLNNDDDGETNGGDGMSRDGIASRSGGAAKAARAGLLALPLDAHVSMMRSPINGGGLVPLTTVIGRRAAPGLVGVINADDGATGAVAAALLGHLAANHDSKSSMPVAVAERGVVPIISARLRSREPRVVVAAAASCLALAELAPRLRSALAGAGVLQCLLAGIVDASGAPSAALFVRALWALLQDDEVWRALEGALRAEVRLGDSTATALVNILHHSVAAHNNGNQHDSGFGTWNEIVVVASSATEGSNVRRHDDDTMLGNMRATTTTDDICAELLSDGLWLRLGGQLGVSEGPAATREAVIGLIWRTTQFPENRVSLLRAGAPSALAAVLAVVAPPSHCLETLLLCAAPGYVEGDAPQQPPAVAAAARQLERLARRLAGSSPALAKQQERQAGFRAPTRARRWISAVVGQLAEETARVAMNLPDDVPADVAPLYAASLVGETRSRLTAISEMLQNAMSASSNAKKQTDHTDAATESTPRLASEAAASCAGALQLLQSSTHAELLRCGAAAGLAAHLGHESERKARMLLAALTVAADAGYARGAAAVSRELWIEGTAGPYKVECS
jgi:hypothetical protein